MAEFLDFIKDIPVRWGTIVPFIIPFLWAGAVIGHSFIATPAKFKAQGLDKPLALEIGRVTFTLFNKIEFIFLSLIFLIMLINQANSYSWIIFTLITLSLLLQVFGIRPALFARATAYQRGIIPPPSIHHKLYALLEGAKFLLLIGLGTSLLSY